MIWINLIIKLGFLILINFSANVYGDHYLVNCSNLLIGQYRCFEPQIDLNTQQPFNCLKNNSVFVNCTLIDGLLCEHNLSQNFTRSEDCLYTNGYYFETTLLLSIFLGIFGVDRFYLGYPAYALIKLCTLGGFFFLYLLDIILIALQIVKPVDNSNYIIKYYGPKFTILNAVNDTIEPEL